VSSWLDYTINGLIVGNVYALVAVGLALIFGVSRLINFAQGSIYLVGAYIGWSRGFSCILRSRPPSSWWRWRRRWSA
jgi:branched-subunit amino acid ABC-type transport system permease component